MSGWSPVAVISGIYYKHITIINDTSLVSVATIWSITLESSNTILEASFTFIYDVYSTEITYDDCQLTIVICL